MIDWRKIKWKKNTKIIADSIYFIIIIISVEIINGRRHVVFSLCE